MKALVAVARSILASVWHLLSKPHTRYRELGSNFHTRNLVRQLQALGHDVTLTPASA